MIDVVKSDSLALMSVSFTSSGVQSEKKKFLQVFFPRFLAFALGQIYSWDMCLHWTSAKKNAYIYAWHYTIIAVAYMDFNSYSNNVHLAMLCNAQ